MLNNNSWTKHARETQFIPDSSSRIPASKNETSKATLSQFNTEIYKHVGKLRMLLKGMFNKIFVHSALKHLITK